MLVGNTQPTSITQSYPVVIQNVLDYLNSLDQASLALGRHEFPHLDSNKAWFVVLEYDKQPVENFKPEVHKYYADLQIVLEGNETMAWSIDTGEHEASEPYLEQRDLQFYKNEGITLNFIHATPNQFYLFTPNIVHITNIQNDDTQPVRKLVVKIHNELLEAK
ncbi:MULTISPECIES: YhcH/YjgK/YiaL family protein [unclassified Vibrio]|uniref:YhcH/YjgK/YiaL family protein n=1 Tax=unclassified Vibrio TaxID=2614977 RepID=UPI0014838C96|nr:MULTISPECIES: YhcH/YjgK/YiaL family protein [unclassified Vibrio]NNN43975.1 DUF386 domain-containing protein [Vibrio sp. 1-1(7)]NNN71799.1 DUF386 domain-containing protein [Vibrio sp. 12-2(3-a)]